MATTDNPENKQLPHEGNNLGQISAKTFVIVENPGTDREDIWDEFETIDQAMQELKRMGDDDCGYDLDIMKRRPDGTLTTEF